jgi:hypothetical protein
MSMRLRPRTDFTKGMLKFVWKEAEDVVLKVGKKTFTHKSAKVKKVRGRRRYEVDV